MNLDKALGDVVRIVGVKAARISDPVFFNEDKGDKSDNTNLRKNGMKTHQTKKNLELVKFVLSD